MASVSVTVALSADSKTNCDVVVSRDNDGNMTWRRFGWSIGGLAWFATSGLWYYEYSEHKLYLMDNDYSIVASADGLRSDFLDAAICGHSIECNGEAWHVSKYYGAKLNFWYGCA